MRPALLLAALVLMAVGALASLLAGTSRRPGRLATFGAAALASMLNSAVGVLSVLWAPRAVYLGNLLGFGQTTLCLDALAGIFLALTGGLGALVSLAAVSGRVPNGPGERAAGAAFLQLLASLTVVLVAADAFTFLFAWEALTLSFYLLAGVSRRRPGQPADAWATAGIGKAGGAALLVGFLLLAGAAHSFELSAWHAVAKGGLHDLAYALVVFGFATKVGLTPFQVWMPRGYSAAPGPLRGAMAGVAVNAGFYGLWRSLALLGRPPAWLAAAVLVLGGLSAVLGIAFVAVEGDLARAVAFSSVENAGVIMVGFGVALTGAYVASKALVAVGLLAASLQVLTHAVAKTGLFVATADFEAAARTTELERLRGMARVRPWASVSFVAGSLALAGLPPSIGFVSEWFVLEALMQQFRVASVVLRLATAAAGALVALTAGLAALGFVRLLAFTVLGRSRAAVVDGDVAASRSSKFVHVAIAASCFAMAAAAPWVVRFVAIGLNPVVPRRITLGALKSPWVLQPVFSNFSALSPSWLAVVLPAGFAAVSGATLLASKGRALSVRRVPAWRSATPGVHGEDSYSAFAFANPARHVLANILGTKKTVTVAGQARRASRAIFPPGRAGAALGATGAGPGEAKTGEGGVSLQAGALPGVEGEGYDHSHVVVATRVREPVESYLYGPAVSAYLAIVQTARRLQSGRLESYVTYMLFALVVVLVVAAAT